MTEVKLKAEGTQLLGIGIAGQPLALGFGNVAGADYVNVVTNSGNPYQWQVVSLASDGRTVFRRTPKYAETGTFRLTIAPEVDSKCLTGGGQTPTLGRGR